MREHLVEGRNRNYSPWAGSEAFERELHREPVAGWHALSWLWHMHPRNAGASSRVLTPGFSPISAGRRVRESAH